MIEYLPQEILEGNLLERFVYPNMARTLYWSDRWDPLFYIDLAERGFICIALEHEDLGPLLIPEMQDRYAVLDWPSLHISRNVRRMLRPERLERAGLVLSIEDPRPEVLPRIRAQYGSECWVIDRYLELVDALLDDAAALGVPKERFAMHGVALRSQASGELLAGEFGYSTGARYTSLSGFCSRETPAKRDFGTLQLVWLARLLEASGYAFWNLGHAEMAYKRALGARSLPRDVFLRRWFGAHGESPRQPMENGHAFGPETLLRKEGTTGSVIDAP